MFKRTLIGLSLLLPLTAAHAGDILNFKFGEWYAMQGACGEFIHESGRYVAAFVTSLTGDKYEAVCLGRAKFGHLTVMAGGGPGALNKKEGVTPFGTLDVRANLALGPVGIQSRFVGRHTRQDRIHDAIIVGGTYTHRGITAGVLYQPIRRAAPSWEHRLAGRVVAPYRGWKFAFEERRSLDANHHVTTLAEIIIPLK